MDYCGSILGSVTFHIAILFLIFLHFWQNARTTSSPFGNSVPKATGMMIRPLHPSVLHLKVNGFMTAIAFDFTA
ncbi:hypothetical protein SBA4_3300009 [Candidatus Sulfopaludibacter sp. SbA4]|nr:hypothetical protein SBA4_3300009 [Candidatus Sulfopaludibacter sp. SbA4]